MVQSSGSESPHSPGIKYAEDLKEKVKNSPKHSSIVDFYNQTDPSLYDEMGKAVNYTEPNFIVGAISETEEAGGFIALPKDVQIYDIGCGTGISGQLLHEKGYHNILGTDASHNFIEACRKRGHYKELREMFSGMGVENFPTDLKERFDVCTACGIWLKGHMPADAMDDIVASLKQGGYYATALRTLYYEVGQEEGYRAKFDSLQSEGKMKLLH